MSKISKGKVILILSVFIIGLMLFWGKKNYLKEEVIKRKEVSLLPVPLKTYVEVKQNFLDFSDNDVKKGQVSVVLFEFRLDRVRQIIVLRTDSVVNMYSEYNTKMENLIFEGNVTHIYTELLKLINDNYDKLPFKRRKLSFMNAYKNELVCYERNNSGQIRQFTIDTINRKSEINTILLRQISSLLSEITHKEVEPKELLGLN